MSAVDLIFGIGAEQLTTEQMLARALVVFFAGWVLIRFAGVRTLGRVTAFDQLTLLIIGSILGRSVISGQNFFGCLAASLLITLLQRIMSWLMYRSKAVGKVFKGRPIPLMRHGRMDERNMARTLVTNEDIDEALHTHLQREDIEGVQDIYLERSGHISFIKKQSDKQ
ncbi:MAG: DUF421 domain-containing protein [Bacteroidetes bacterium]|nr:DUF421 domain-containing protein [Bacteroidota bacterium]